MKLKRLAAGITAAVMAFAVMGTPLGDILPFVRESVATTAGAYRDGTDGDYDWRYYTYYSEVTITFYSGNEKDIIIPEFLNGCRVVCIDGGFTTYPYNRFETIEMPNSIKVIDQAFKGCVKATKIKLSSSLTYIGDCSFKNCESLEQINIPETVTYIGKESFSECTSLKSIRIPEGVTAIDDYAFKNCSSFLR